MRAYPFLFDCKITAKYRYGQIYSTNVPILSTKKLGYSSKSSIFALKKERNVCSNTLYILGHPFGLSTSQEGFGRQRGEDGESGSMARSHRDLAHLALALSAWYGGGEQRPNHLSIAYARS